MGRPKKGNIPIHARLSLADLEALKREKHRTGAESLSAVMEAVLVLLLEQTADGRRGTVTLPLGPSESKRRYMISPAVAERVDAMKKRAGCSKQQVVKAALATLRNGSGAAK